MGGRINIQQCEACLRPVASLNAIVAPQSKQFSTASKSTVDNSLTTYLVHPQRVMTSTGSVADSLDFYTKMAPVSPRTTVRPQALESELHF